MSRPSLRIRLVLWYMAVLAPAVFVLAIGGAWLFKRSLIGAADVALAARIDGVRAFIANAEEERLSPEGLRDEFLEFAQLTSGEVLLEVVGRDGEVFCAPMKAGWSGLSAALTDRGAIAPEDVWIAGAPYRVAVATIDARDNHYRALVATPMEQTAAALAQFRRALLFLIAGVLIAAAAGGYWITGRALAPVGRMTREVHAITVRNLDRRVDLPRSDADLERLASTFNAMLARLQRSVADLSRLTADASHELRTPVTLVRTTAEVALARERSPAEYRESLTEILSQAERLSTLVDDLLALARADAGVETRDAESADLAEALRAAGDDVRASAERGSLDLAIDAAPEPVRVVASPESLRRLLVILLSNAVRYTPAGGHVGVRVESDPAARTATLDVVDSGIGVDPAERARVFDRFYRGTAARAVAPEGSGLGLAIASAIVTSHRGAIEIKDSPKGGGCHVRVTFPLAS